MFNGVTENVHGEDLGAVFNTAVEKKTTYLLSEKKNSPDQKQSSGREAVNASKCVIWTINLLVGRPDGERPWGVNDGPPHLHLKKNSQKKHVEMLSRSVFIQGISDRPVD